MIFINLAVILLFIMLAIISRKNFSKYKDMGGIYYAFFLWLGVGDMLYEKILCKKRLIHTERNLRKIKVASSERIHNLIGIYFVRCISAGLVIVFVFNLLSIYTTLSCSKENRQNIIERENYQGDTKTQDIYLDAEGESYVYSLKVEPVQYTEAEFLASAELLFDSLTMEILGENKDAEHISYNLELPSQDKDGIFKISWSSDEPEYITSYGQVNLAELEQDMVAVLTATVSYRDYAASREYPLVLRTQVGSVDVSVVDIAGQKLDELEQENRNKRAFTIPEEISGVEISLSNEKKNKALQLFAIGFVLGVIPLCLMLSEIKKKGERRDNMLLNHYTAFVNKLWLLLGTGMTIKASMKKLTEDSAGKDILKDELMYTIREIDTGVDEAFAYERLGIRLSLQQYTRLMSHISQNLRLGTKDLSMIMEDEVHLAMQARKERAVKLGEQASTRLLFPMIMMLVTVMVIIIMPAILRF